MPKLKFTDKALRALRPPTDKPQVVYWDTEEDGLTYVLGRGGTGTFVSVYRDSKKKKKRETLGRFPEMSLPAAKTAHAVVVGKVAGGQVTPGDVRRATASGPTLASATAFYLTDMAKRACRPNSMDSIRREIADPKTSHVKEWLDRPLRSITAREAIWLHDEISKKGKHVANRVITNLGTIYDTTGKLEQREDPTWPANPFRVVTLHSGDQEGFVERRREPIPWSGLPAWKAEVDGLKSPVRRVYNFGVLLTALRRVDALTIRLEHLNLTDEEREVRVWNVAKQIHEVRVLPPRSILRPNPKGGPEHAFIVPLSTQAVELFSSLIAYNKKFGRFGGDDGGWLFPGLALKTKPCVMCKELGLGDHVKGRVTHKGSTMQGGEIHETELRSPHRLRDTYVTASEQAKLKDGSRVPDGAAKVLVNHEWGNEDVTAGYRRQDHDFLAECQQAISDFLCERMVPRAVVAKAPALESAAPTI